MLACPLNIIEDFAPFCHGTDRWSAERIDVEGLKSAMEAGRTSIHVGTSRSKEDRIYIGTTKTHRGCEKCVEGAMMATKKAMRSRGVEGNYRDHVVIYVLKEIPPGVTPIADEDVYIGTDRKETFSPVQSLRYVHSFALQGVIPPEYLQKMSLDEFEDAFRCHCG
jgi:hypothetical protein